MSKARTSWSKLIDESNQPCWVVDADWRIVVANPALAAWCGVGSGELLGQQLHYNSVDQVSALAPDPLVFSGRTVETTIVHPRDAGTSLRVRWLPLHDADGLVHAAVAWEVSHADADQGSPARIKPATDWHALLAEHRARARGQASLNRFVGESLAMQVLRSRAELAARHGCHAWIAGPTGSGRRTLARTIHSLHPAADVPSVEWDAALLTPELLDRHVSEFMALNQAPALKDAATPVADVLLFNAEHLMAAHFRPLQQLTGKTPVRFLVTSSVSAAQLPNLEQWPANFAAEWSALSIELPPLAARLANLPLLVQHLVEELNQAGTKQLRGCSLPALELLSAYRWPGEMAELARVIDAAHLAAGGIEIQPADLPPWLRQAESVLRSPRVAPVAIDLDQQLAAIERELLARALQLADGNKTAAAKLVGWSRQRLLRRGEELGLIQPAPLKPEPDEPEFIPDLPFEPEE